MFGHSKGAFTGAIDTTRGRFELANNGTIFLDEITNMAVNVQSRLLRVIQEKEISRVGSLEKTKVDMRIISATNKELLEEIREGRFRQDLFYRLNVVPIHVPPLRERREDIPELVEYFLAKASMGRKKDMPQVSADAMLRLERYDWPGNIRELRNTIEYAMLTCKDNVITLDDLSMSSPDLKRMAAPLEQGFLAQSEKREIVSALRQFGGHRSKTAEFLGISRKTLRDKIRKYQIEI
jgi:transcriptional regulator with PAS, ATPase and Fis domain